MGDSCGSVVSLAVFFIEVMMSLFPSTLSPEFIAMAMEVLGVVCREGGEWEGWGGGGRVGVREVTCGVCAILLFLSSCCFNCIARNKLSEN